MIFSEDMDFSIWDCPYIQDESCSPANTWPYDLYFNPRLDVIEEDALNEKSCIQVLKILIAKDEAEILEIEEDIATLQSELALAEEKWNALCLTTLSKSIDFLDGMMHDLKNANVDDELNLGTQHMNPKLAERIHEVLRAMLQDYRPKSDVEDEVFLAAHNSPSSTAQKVASTQHMEKVLNSSTSNIDSGISTEAKKNLDSLSSASRATADMGGLIAVTKDSAAEPLKDDDCSNQTNKRTRIGSEGFCEDEARELSNADENMVLSTTEEAKAAGGNFGPIVVSINQEATHSSMKQKAKESVTAQSIKKETTSQPLETQLVSLESHCRVKGQVALLSRTDKEERKTQIKIEPQENDALTAQLEALAKSNNQNLSLKSRSEEPMEKEWPLFAKMARVVPGLAVELDSKPPPEKLKTQCKSANSCLGNKNSDETKNVGSTRERKRKICVGTLDFTVMDDQATGCPSSANSSMPVSIAEVDHMNMTQLRALAKQLKLTGWSRLKKAQLQQTLHLSLQGKDEHI